MALSEKAVFVKGDFFSYLAPSEIFPAAPRMGLVKLVGGAAGPFGFVGLCRNQASSSERLAGACGLSVFAPAS